METILVIEDDPTVQKALQHLFGMAGYSVSIHGEGTLGLEACRSFPPSAVVLDLNLPGQKGQDVCREIKRETPSLPVVVLSATSDVTDKVVLLELGADDYVTKPFSPRELLARVQAAVRRSTRTASAEAFGFGDIAVDFTKMTVSRNGTEIGLTAQEFKLLRFLIANQERAISRDELLNEVWGYDHYPSTRTVDNHILRLRHKLEGDPSEPIHFRTVHAVGYRFIP
jgi:two-component system alkaline phosphatase synthesis response regulator PhoP